MKKYSEPAAAKTYDEKDRHIDHNTVVSQAEKIGYFNEVKEFEVCLEVGDGTKWCDKDQFVNEVLNQMSSGKTLTLAIHYAVLILWDQKLLSRYHSPLK